VSDADGKFKIEDLPAGEQVFRVCHQWLTPSGNRPTQVSGLFL
jgi:hypothetical protein